MEKIKKLLGRSKTFNSYDNKRRNHATKADGDGDVAADTSHAYFDKSRNFAYEQQHLSKVSNPTDPQGTLKRFEKENLQRRKIKQIIGLDKAYRNSFSSDDITIRKPAASPKPVRQRTKTMFDFFTSKTKKSPLPTKKPPLKVADSNFLKPPIRGDGNLDHHNIDNGSSSSRKAKIDDVVEATVPETSLFVSKVLTRKDSGNMFKKKAPELMSSVEIDICDVPMDEEPERKPLQFMRHYSRSMNDVQVPVQGSCIRALGSVRELKERFEDVPIMGRISLVNKAPANIDSSISPGSNRRSSLPVDFKDLPPIAKDKRDKTMATQQQSQMYHGSPSNVNKNSQHNLVPKSPTKFGDSNEDNQNTQKTSTNRKSIKNILQKFLNRRPSQQELVTKGIIQDQQIFGNSLRNLCKSLPAGRKVPEFVSAVMCMIQAPCNVVSHGIYRASGNIATIQKIRFRVNEGKNLDILKEYRNDVDVLTGSLKLFFRELTEPLISTHMLQDLCALKDRELTDHDRLLSEADKIIKRQPDYHRDVLTELINHILYVNSFGDKNSMSIDSMSIVWGPSLIFTDNEDSGMLLQRITNNNSIVKFLLNIYNADYIPSKHIPPQRLYSSESTLSLASTSDKGSTSRPSLKQQHSVDDSLCIDDLELLIKSIQDSELAKKMNVYVMYKGKKSKKIIDRIKAKKSIEKYTTTKDGLCGIVETLKSFVYHSAVVPEDFLRNYDGGTLSKKQIEAALDQLPTTNQRILSLVLNHLNDMQKINPEKYSLNLLLESWIKVLFMNHQANANAFKCFEQLLVYYQSSKQFQIDQTAHQKHMMSDLNDNLQLRGRLSVCESFLDDEDFQPDRISTDSAADVEIRKSQLYIVREEQERRKNNRNS